MSCQHASALWPLASVLVLLQFPLDKEVACADDLAGVGVLDDEDIVGVLRQYPVVALVKGLLANLADGGENPQAVEKAGLVVGEAERAGDVAHGKRGGNGGRDEVGREKALFRHVRGG